MDAVKALLEKGANPNLRNGPGKFQGVRPLYIASRLDKMDVVKALLEGGADPNLPNEPRYDSGGEPSLRSFS